METLCRRWHREATRSKIVAAEFVAPNLLAVRTKQDLLEEKSERISCIRYCRKDGTSIGIPPQRIDPQIKQRVRSPNGCAAAVVRKNENAHSLEIWSEDAGYQKVVFPKTLHGDVHVSNQLGRISWSPDGKYLAYVAERKIEKLAPLSTFATKDEKRRLGPTFLHRWDLGEQYDDCVRPNIFVLDCDELLRSGRVDISQIPCDADHIIGDPQLFYVNSVLTVCFTRWAVEPKRLGLVYCPIRPSAICVATLADDGIAWTQPRSLTNEFKIAH